MMPKTYRGPTVGNAVIREEWVGELEESEGMTRRAQAILVDPNTIQAVISQSRPRLDFLTL